MREEGEERERFLTLQTPGTPADPAHVQSESSVWMSFRYIFLKRSEFIHSPTETVVLSQIKLLVPLREGNISKKTAAAVAFTNSSNF